MKSIKGYLFTVQFPEIGRKFSIMFLQPPVRKHVEEVFRESWNALLPEQQDSIWEWLLILDFIPETEWSGLIETLYGTVQVIEKYIIDNGE